jgi:hypothetical protein
MVASVRPIATYVDTAIHGLNFPQLSHSEACHSEAHCFFGVRAHNKHQTTTDGHTQCIATLIATAISDADGKASESSDHKSQTYDALVVHLQNPDAKAHVDTLTVDTTTDTKDDSKTDTHEVLRDVDGYFETPNRLMPRTPRATPRACWCWTATTMGGSRPPTWMTPSNLLMVCWVYGKKLASQPTILRGDSLHDF